MNVTAEQINKAYTELKVARQVYNGAIKRFVDAENKLDLVEANAIRQGLEGSNKQKRQAELAEIVKEEADAVVEAEHQKTFARFTLTLAEDEVRRVRLLVRFDDIASRELEE